MHVLRNFRVFLGPDDMSLYTTVVHSERGVNACRASEATQQKDCRVRRELGASEVVPAISSTPPAEVSSPSREKRFGNS